MFRRQYFEAVANCIGPRFDQPGYFYKDDFNSGLLRTQLESLNASFKENKDISCVDMKAILKYFRSTSPVYRTLFSEVIKLLKLILVLPATNAISERSFSTLKRVKTYPTLKRVKTYLSTTMTQRRLNNLLLLHVHKDKTDNIDLDLKEISNDFVCNENRLRVFEQF